MCLTSELSFPLSTVPLTLCRWANTTRISFFIQFHPLMFLKNLTCIQYIFLPRLYWPANPSQTYGVYSVSLINLLCFPRVSSSFWSPHYAFLRVSVPCYLCCVVASFGCHVILGEHPDMFNDTVMITRPIEERIKNDNFDNHSTVALIMNVARSFHLLTVNWKSVYIAFNTVLYVF